MNIHEVITGVLALFCGYFAGLGYGYRTANREYKEAVDGAVETMQRGSKVIEKLRQRLVAKRIIEMKQLGKSAEQR
jgi:hypothetical protein